MIIKNPFARVAILIACSAAPGIAAAHVGQGDLSGGFIAGFEHPILGWDHIIAMVAVGLWGAQLGKPAIWLLPVTFPIVMAFGGALGAFGIPIPGVEFGIALSALVLGLMVALAMRPPLWFAAIIVGIFAIFHGHAHGAELPASANPMTYSAGFVLATGGLHLIGISIGNIHRWKAGAYVLRGLGALIGGGGAYFLAQAFAGATFAGA